MPVENAMARPEGDPERLLVLVKSLVDELHGTGETRVKLASVLDRDLGLDSVSRVELLARLEREWGVRFPQERIIQAETVADLLVALGQAQRSGPERNAPGSRAPHPPAHLVTEDFDTLTAVLQWHATEHADQTHARVLDSAGGAHTLTYGELLASARSVASGLLRLGVEPGDRVALMLPTSTDYLVCFCASLLLGAVPVPLYPPARLTLLEEHLERQQRILQNAGAAVLISVPEALPFARLLRGSLPRLSALVTCADLARSNDSLPELGHRPEDLALIQYTSGSTGDPKGVMLSHRNLLANIRAMGRAVQVTSQDVMVSWLPLYHDMGLIGCWLSALYFGFPVVLMSPLAFLANPRCWLATIHETRGTLSCAPNFAYEMCLRRLTDADLEGLDLSSWRFALNGSEPVSARTLQAFQTRLAKTGFRGSALTPAYGLAECSVALTFSPVGRGPRIDRVRRGALLAEGRAIPALEHTDERFVTSVVSCGVPLAGHEVRIIGPLGLECPEREVGEVQFRGASATRGYLGRNEETRALYDRGWLHTGDLGYIAQGELYLVGRSKDVIIRAGQHIHPQELEQVIGDVPGIRKGCVIAFGSQDARTKTERVVIVAETKELHGERKAALVARATATAAQLLGAPPDEVLLVPPHSVPKTSSGKLRRGACRAAYERGELGPRRSAFAQLLRLRVRGLVQDLQLSARTLSATLHAAYAWLVFASLASGAWLLVLLLPRLQWRLQIAHATARLLAYLTRTPVVVSGLEHLPQGGCVLVANHESNIDPFVLYAALPPRFTVIAKAELARHWWTRIPLDRLGIEYVERGIPAESLLDARRILQKVKAGCTPVFFPEGTHSRIAGLLPFRMGAFVTAADAQLPVVPIAIDGTRSILRSDTYFPRRGGVHVTVGPALPPTGTDFAAALSLKDQARAFILAHTGEPSLE